MRTTTMTRENDFTLFGILCAAALSVVLLIKKVAALYEYSLSKYPRATIAVSVLILFCLTGLLGKSDMEAEIALYGN